MTEPLSLNKDMSEVIIENVPRGYFEDNLRFLIDDPEFGIELEGNIDSIEIDSQVAIVKFTSLSDAEKLIKKGLLKIEEHEMPVTKPDPTAVLVTGLSEDIQETFFKLYFSNPKESGGDRTVKIEIFEPEIGVAVIRYKEKNVAEEVIRKKNHKFLKTNLVAKWCVPEAVTKLRKKSRVTQKPRHLDSEEEDKPPPDYHSTKGFSSDKELAASQRYRSDRSNRPQRRVTSPRDYETDEDYEMGSEAEEKHYQPRKARASHSTIGSRSDEERAANQRYRSDRSNRPQRRVTSPRDYETDEDDEMGPEAEEKHYQPRKTRASHSTTGARSDEERAANQRYRSDRSNRPQRRVTSPRDYETDEDYEMGPEAEEKHYQPRKTRASHSTIGARSDEERAANQRYRSDRSNRPQRRVTSPRVYETDEDDEVREKEGKVHARSILVEGIPPSMKKETIRRYFEKESSSGGGKIESQAARADGSCIITFKERTSVEKILKKELLSLGESTLTVKDLGSPEFEESKMVYIFGDLSNVSKEGLDLYLEDISGVNVEHVKYGTGKGVALAIFKEKIDYQILKKKANNNPVEDEDIDIGKVQCSSAVQVSLQKKISSSQLKRYFENFQESGGVGPVSLERIEENVFLIHFEETTSAQAVGRMKHFLDKEELVVSVHYGRLGLIPPDHDTSKPILKLPNPKTFKVNPLLLKYIKGRKAVEAEINRKMRSLNAKLDLSHSVEDEIKIDYELQSDTENVRSLIAKWHDNVSDATEALLSKYDYSSVHYSQKCWHEICEELQEYRETMDESVMILERRNNFAVVVIGPKEKIEEVLNHVHYIAEQVQERKESVTQEMDINIAKLQVLLKKGVQKTLSSMWPRISVRTSKKDEKMMLSGNSKEIIKAMKVVQNELKNIIEYEVSMTPMKLDVISSPIGSKHIKALLQEKELCAFIECDTDEVIITGDKATVKRVEKLLSDEVSESSIPISQLQILQSDKWDHFKNALKSKSGIAAVLDEDMNRHGASVRIAAIKQDHDMLKKELKKFLDDNLVKEEFIPAGKFCVKLLSKYFMEELKRIESEFAVKIFPEEKGQSIGFYVTGTAPNIDNAVDMVKGNIKSLKFESFNMKQPGQSYFLKSERGEKLMRVVENENKVLVEVVEEKDVPISDLSIDPVNNTEVLQTVKTKKGVEIKVIFGDITEHRTDVLVNPITRKLQLNRGLSAALIKKGGVSIQQGCDHHIKINGMPDYGEVVITKAGALPAMRIIHAVGREKWDDDFLYDCVWTCLNLANREDFRTIAIPAMGSGMSGITVDDATETIVEAIYEFLDTEDCRFNAIDLIDQNRQVAERFDAALRNMYGVIGRKPSFRGAPRFVSTSKRPLQDSKADASSFVTKEGVNINIVKGEIAKQRTDAIVNSVASSMNLSSGALSNSIIAAMDPQSKQDVQAEANKHKGASNGKVIHTTAGNLACETIFHIVLPAWKKNDPTVAKLLPDALRTILTECHQTGLTSLAIPSVGTGNLNWPADVVAESFFDEVIAFSRRNLQTKLKTVYFVIFPTDAKSAAAFYNHIGRLGHNPSPGAVKKAGSPNFDGLQIGNLTIEVTSGDITKEATDGIVNSSNSKLDLSQGTVSKALANLGGDSFRAECQQQGSIAPNTVVVTGAGNLGCKYVIHFDAQSANGKWKDTIARCLEKADEKKMQSLAFPALGTGNLGGDPAAMAKHLMEGFADFAKKGPTSLTLVRVVIFQTEMFQLYLSKMEELHGSKLSPWGWGKRLKNLFGFGGATYETGQLSQLQSPKPSSESAIFRLDIHGKTKRDIDSAYEAIDKMWQDESGDFTIGGNKDTEMGEIIKSLSDKEKQQLLSTVEQQDVKVDMEENQRSIRIRVRGPTKKASDVSMRIREMLYERKWTEAKKEKAQHAQLLGEFVQWENESKKGTFLPYPEEINSLLEKAFRDKKDTVTTDRQPDGKKKMKITFDFKQMCQIDNGITSKIRRRNIAPGQSLPDFWKPMNEQTTCIKVKLDETSQEFKDVANAFHLTTNVKIKQIDRIQNPQLYRLYTEHKMDMKKKKSQALPLRRCFGMVPELILQRRSSLRD